MHCYLLLANVFIYIRELIIVLELHVSEVCIFLTVGDGMQERPSIPPPSIIYETQLSLCHPKPFYSSPLYSCTQKSVNYSSQISLERLSCFFLSLSLWTLAVIISSERSRNIYWIFLSLFLLLFWRQFLCFFTSWSRHCIWESWYHGPQGFRGALYLPDCFISTPLRSR